MGFGLDQIVAAIVCILILVFGITYLRLMLGLRNDTVGYQLNLLSLGAFVATLSVASVGGNYWAGFDLSGISKGVTLFSLATLQIFAFLGCLRLEQRRLDRPNSVSYNILGGVLSIGLGSFALALMTLTSMRWS